MRKCWMTIPGWDGEGKNVHVLIRGTVSLPFGQWTLCVCGYDFYQLFIDGVYMGQGPIPADPEHPCYDSYSLSGGCTVTVAVHLYAQGLINRVRCGGKGRLGLWLSLRGEGTKLPIRNLRCMRCYAYSGATVGYETSYLENFDSSLWPEGWEKPGYQDDKWEPVEWIHGPQPTPRPVKALWEGILEPANIRPIPGGTLLDMGRETAGNLSLRAVGPAGSRVTLCYAEELDEDGRARFDMRCGCRYEEIWTLGRGESGYHPCDYKAFRYIEILHGPEVTILSRQVRGRCYPMEEGACTLECPSEELEDIFRICKNAVRWCTQEGFLDCATREKGQYLGDALITAHSQVWLTGSTEMLRKSIRDFMATQNRFEGILAVAPCTWVQKIADYSLLFPMLPLMDYAFTGDRVFFGECYPAVRKMLAWFDRFRREDGLLETVREAWNLVDWPESARDHYDFPLPQPVVGHGCHNVINALWYGANRMREEMEMILGLPVSDVSGRIGSAFRACFFRPEQHLFADSEESRHCSIHANIYPAFFGLLPEEGENAFEALLLTPGRYCGVMPMYFALEGLARLGKRETMYRLLTRTDEFGWRNMLRQDATACFEAWGKEQKWNTSLCHPWASGPIPLIIEQLAGIHPDPNREEGFRFTPALPDDLPDFSLTVPWRGCSLTVRKTAGQPAVLEKKIGKANSLMDCNGL